jgi:Ca-activated chloride channel family protein
MSQRALDRSAPHGGRQNKMRWRSVKLAVTRSMGLVSHFRHFSRALGICNRSTSRTEFLFSILLIGALLTTSPRTLAQEKETDEVVKVNTNLVVFDAQVIDKDTKWVIGDLNKDDFEVFENGVKQPISYFSRDSIPLSVILLLDVSGSVRPVLHQIRDGALHALERLKPDDQVAVMAFATTRELVLDFTKDRAMVSKRIEAATATDRLGQGTLLGPALDDAAIRMQLDDAAVRLHKGPAQTSRRVIIVITDNIADTERSEQKQILEELFDSGTVVYGLIVRAALGKVFNLLSLGKVKGVDEFVKQTGGEILDTDKNDVDEKLAVVVSRLRARYAIGFQPTNTAVDEKFRLVEIKIKAAVAKKRKENPVVLTKRGYYFRRK